MSRNEKTDARCVQKAIWAIIQEEAELCELFPWEVLNLKRGARSGERHRLAVLAQHCAVERAQNSISHKGVIFWYGLPESEQPISLPQLARHFGHKDHTALVKNRTLARRYLTMGAPKKADTGYVTACTEKDGSEGVQAARTA